MIKWFLKSPFLHTITYMQYFKIQPPRNQPIWFILTGERCRKWCITIHLIPDRALKSNGEHWKTGVQIK